MAANPIRLPLSPRQADALAHLLDELTPRMTFILTIDESAALREVAEKLDNLREK